MTMRMIPLCSGSSGNATYIETADARILVDAGLSCKKMAELLRSVGVEPDTLTALLITHEHIDHIKGVEVLSKKYGVPVYANADCWFSMRQQKHCLAVPPAKVCVFESDIDFYLGKTRVLPFTTPHDAAHSVGFVITSGGHKAAVCTDIGHVDKRMLGILSGVDILVIEANHDVDMLMAGPYPYQLKKRILGGNGHLNNEDCGRALAALYKTGVRNAVLGHLSAENNFPALAVATVRAVLDEAGITDMQLALANRDTPTGIFEIG